MRRIKLFEQFNENADFANEKTPKDFSETEWKSTIAALEPDLNSMKKSLDKILGDLKKRYPEMNWELTPFTFTLGLIKIGYEITFKKEGYLRKRFISMYVTMNSERASNYSNNMRITGKTKSPYAIDIYYYPEITAYGEKQKNNNPTISETSEKPFTASKIMDLTSGMDDSFTYIKEGVVSETYYNKEWTVTNIANWIAEYAKDKGLALVKNGISKNRSRSFTSWTMGGYTVIMVSDKAPGAPRLDELSVYIGDPGDKGQFSAKNTLSISEFSGNKNEMFKMFDEKISRSKSDKPVTEAAKPRKHPVYAMIEKIFKKFPSNATSWRYATDEPRDLARMAREAYTEMDLDMLYDEWETNPNAPQPLNFRAIKTPAEWNTKAKQYIIDTLDKMSDKTKTYYMDLVKEYGHELLDESNSGNTITYSVRYEARAEDGDSENRVKDFNEDQLEQAMKFAKEKYSSIDYVEEDAKGDIVDQGFVNVNDKSDGYGKRVSYKKR